jgi:hypothetical protein
MNGFDPASTSGDVHIVRVRHDWLVRIEGWRRPHSRHINQRDAITVGRQVAKRSRSDFYVHGRDGQVRERSLYRGNESLVRSGWMQHPG